LTGDVAGLAVRAAMVEVSKVSAVEAELKKRQKGGK
jgi:hypothetical protein